MVNEQTVLKAISRHTAKVQRHRIGCRCIRCAQLRVRMKRYARRRGLLPEVTQ
jgi:hypothetical protein